MKGKRLRFPFEHAASSARDCLHLGYLLLSVVDADAGARRPSPMRDRLLPLIKRLEVVGNELWSIRGELVRLRHDPGVKALLDPEVAEGLGALERLDDDFFVLIVRAAMNWRAHGARRLLVGMHVDAEALKALTGAMLAPLVQVIERASQESACHVLETLVALEALHDEESFEEAMERECRRWR